MLLLGIDQSMDGPAGFAVLDTTRPGPQQVVFTHVEYYKQEDGSSKNIPKHDTRWRCRRFAAVLQVIYKSWQPDLVVTEIVRAYHHNTTNTNTISALSEIQGAMNLVIPKITPIYKFNTGSWQAVALTPKRGQDRKALSKMLVKNFFGLEVTEHEADAIHMCLSFAVLKDNPNPHIVERL